MQTPSRFEALGLSPKALAALARAGFTTPTPVQEQAIPLALAGKDVIGCAATGTGKTAAFLLPIVEQLRGCPRGAKALVLAPTRELVIQIADHLETLGDGTAFVEIVGGMGMAPQARGLREGRTVIIATPGRLIDHMERGDARLDTIGILVLDEADRMLDMGFRPQLERILAKLTPHRQTMLFSATMSGDVADFARRCLREPVRVEVARSGTVAARAEQQVFHVPQHEKTALLLSLLARDEDTTLVFTRTKHRAERLAKQLSKAGHRAARIHGDRSQGQRVDALNGFKDGRYRVLVATDIAARGIDVEQIGHVVNYDLSRNAEDHVHRVGRTARASASGRASSFCSPEETGLLREIERFTRMSIPRAGHVAPAPQAAAQAAPPRPFVPSHEPAPLAADRHAPHERHAHPSPRRGRRLPWHLRSADRRSRRPR